MPAILREFVSSLDDKVWQTELYKLLQSQSFNQVEVDLFELLCKVLDHNLFAQVDWARNSYYFKELKVGAISFLFSIYSMFFKKNSIDPILVDFIMLYYCIHKNCNNFNITCFGNLQ